MSSCFLPENTVWCGMYEHCIGPPLIEAKLLTAVSGEVWFLHGCEFDVAFFFRVEK